MEDRAFLCFVSGCDDAWEAICTDLDIAVHARSERDARDRLTGAVQSYIEDAAREAKPVRDRLLARRAPWHVVLRWRLRVTRSALALTGRGREQLAGFTLPCRV